MKLSLAQMGLGIGKLFKGRKAGRTSPTVKERELFEEEAKSQLRKLKEKGITLPIFTL